MKVKILLLITAIIFTSNVAASQYEYNDKIDSLSGFDQSFGYGIGNLGHIVSEGSSYRPSIYFDYSLKKSESVFYRVGATFNYRSFDNGNIKQREFIPTIFTAGLEKHFYLDKLFCVLGADLFYSASAKHTTLSGFQVDDMGVGVAAFGGVGFALRNDLSLFAQSEWGGGLFREFVGVGNTTIATLRMKGTAIRSLSFGIRHFF